MQNFPPPKVDTNMSTHNPSKVVGEHTAPHGSDIMAWQNLADAANGSDVLGEVRSVLADIQKRALCSMVVVK